LVILSLIEGWGVWLGLLTMVGNPERIAHVVLALAAGLTAPAHLAQLPNHHLHRLGVDYAAQVRHNLQALSWCAAVPTLAAASVTAAIAGFDAQRIRLLLLIVAAFAVRAGWRGFTGARETAWRILWRQRWPGVLLVLLAALPWLPPWPAVAAALAGASGLLLRLRRLDERQLMLEMVEQDSPT
jgi:hypothetical protein